MSAIGRLHPPSHPEAGFTLIEALVTVTLTAMIGALVYPVMDHGVAAVAFQQAEAGLRADLRMARGQALRTGTEVDLAIDPLGHGYGWTPGPQRELLAGLDVAPAGGHLRFYPDGSSSGGVLVLSDGRRALKLTVAPDPGILQATP